MPKVQHSECDPVGCSEWASEVPVQRMRTHEWTWDETYRRVYITALLIFYHEFQSRHPLRRHLLFKINISKFVTYLQTNCPQNDVFLWAQMWFGTNYSTNGVRTPYFSIYLKINILQTRSCSWTPFQNTEYERQQFTTSWFAIKYREIMFALRNASHPFMEICARECFPLMPHYPLETARWV